MKRLSEEAVKFIKNYGRSYSTLSREMETQFGIKLSKSLISYYKGSKPRIKPIDIMKLSEWELEWLFGLYFADGSKFKEKSYCYTIKFDLDKKRDTDIGERLVELLTRIGLKPTMSFDRNVLVVRVFSKNLYNIFPDKVDSYQPRNILAFASGMIDGDGAVNERRTGAYIVQTYFENLMSYLTKNLGLTRYEQRGSNAGWTGIKITYYVPKSVCEVLKDKKYCVKLLRKINKTNN